MAKPTNRFSTIYKEDASGRKYMEQVAEYIRQSAEQQTAPVQQFYPVQQAVTGKMDSANAVPAQKTTASTTAPTTGQQTSKPQVSLVNAPRAFTLRTGTAPAFQMEDQQLHAYLQYLVGLSDDEVAAEKNALAYDTINTNYLRPEKASLLNMRYPWAVQQLLEAEKKTNRNRDLGLYDSEENAYTQELIHLPQTSYLEALRVQNEALLEESKRQDALHDDFAMAMQAVISGDSFAYEEYMKGEKENPYQSMSPVYQARIDMLKPELGRRNSGYTEMSQELRSSPDFGQIEYVPMTNESYAAFLYSQGPLGQLAGAFGATDSTAVMFDYMMNYNYAAEYDARYTAANGILSSSGYNQRGLNLLDDVQKDEALKAMAQGEEHFLRWLSSLEATGILTRRRAEIEKAMQQNLAEHPLTAVPMFAASRVANLGASVMAPVQAIGAAFGATDPNSSLYTFNRFNQNVDTAQSKKLGELLPWQIPLLDQNVGSFIFDAVAGLADFGVALGVGNAVGGAKYASAVTQYLMSSQAASDTLMEGFENDRDPAETLVRASVAALIEAFTEKYSIDELMKDPKSFLSFVRNNILTEASEGGASDLLNTAADSFISAVTGSESKLTTQYKALRAQNVDETQASRQVLMDYLRGLAGNVLMEGFAGGVMGGVIGSHAISEQTKTGEEISGAGNLGNLLDIGLTMNINTESRSIAEGIQKAQSENRKVPLRTYGLLFKTMMSELHEDIGSVVSTVMHDAVTQRLGELDDDSPNRDETADAILAVVREEKPTAKQRRALAQSSNSNKVIQELMFTDGKEASTTVTTSDEQGSAAPHEQMARDARWVKDAMQKASDAMSDISGKIQQGVAMTKGKEQTDATIQSAKEKAEKMLSKVSTDKKSMYVTTASNKRGEIQKVTREGEEIKVDIKMEDGSTEQVPVAELQLESRPVAEIVAYVDENSEVMSDDKANLLINTYTGGDASAHIADFNAAYNAGFSGNETPTVERMDPQLAQNIAQQGKKDAEAAEAQRIRTVGAIALGRKGKVTFSESGSDMGSEHALNAISSSKELTDSQKRSIDVLKQLSRVTGINFVLFRSKADAQGNFGKENGRYEAGTGTIYLDLNSGRSNVNEMAEFAILRTASHELTHFIEHNSKEGYAALRNFVVTELIRRGEDFDDLVAKKMDAYAAGDKPLTRAGAIAEVIADASEMMLRDTKAIERLAAKDASLMGQIKGFMKSFVTKLKQAFNGVGTAHDEASKLMSKVAKEFQDKWDIALEEAVETAREGAVEAEPVAETQTQFEMREPVEQRKDGLMAVHNLNATKLMDTLRLGGFPMPSIAIIKAKHGHDMYGPYSVVFGPQTIDPKADKANRVYGNDAWTPTFPRVERAVDSNALYDVEMEIQSSASQVDDEMARKSRAFFGNFGGTDVTDKTDDDIAHSAWNYDGILAAYLIERGETVEMLTKEVDAERPYNVKRADEYDRILDIVDALDYANMPMHELLDKYSNQLSEVSASLRRLSAYWANGDRRAGAAMARVIKEAIEYEGSGRDVSEKKTQVKDYQATRQAMEDRIDRSSFDAWIIGKLAGSFGQQGIYNGVERFTRSGNRKSFKQTHYDYTVENVVRAMLQEAESAIPATNASGLKAAASTRYGSIEEIRADSYRLGKVSEEQFNAMMAKADNDLHDFLNAIEALDYDVQEDAGNLLVTAAKRKLNVKEIAELFKANGFKKATLSAARIAESVIRQVQTIPTGYLEAKPARVVSFDEVRMVVAPENIPAELAAALDERGIPYTTYSEADGDRLAKLNAVEDVQFSIRDGRMTPESTEEERYEILKNAVLHLAAVQYNKLEDIDLAAYNTRKKSDVDKNIRALAKKLGITNVDLQNSQISFPFQFTNKNLGKSLNHQLDYGGTYQDYVKAMSCFDEIVDSAIPIETHIDKKRGTKKVEPGLKQVYVLVGAFSDGATITPVQLEIKENQYRGNKLYLTVMLTKINPEVVENGLAAKGGSVRPLFSGSTISLRSLIENVNTKDYKFFKYIPDQFLNKEQKAAKERALQDQDEEYAGYGDRQSSLRDMPSDLTREYMANLTADDAINDVEKDAIRVYTREVRFLRQAQEKLDQVIAERDAQPEAKQAMYTERVNELRRMITKHYDQLTKLEATKGVAPLMERSRAFVQEFVQGKTEAQVEKLILSTEREVERLNNLIKAGNSDLVKERNRRVQELKQLRSKATEKLLAEQERYRKMIATDREIRTMTQKASKLQSQIAAKVKALDHLRRHETDYKNVPEAFKPAVDTLVGMFADNFGSMVFTGDKAKALSEIYGKLRTEDGSTDLAAYKPYYDPDVEEMLKELAELAEKDAQMRTTSGKGTTRKDMAQDRLVMNEDIKQVVDHIAKIVTDAQNLFYGGRKAQFDAIGTQIGNELNTHADAKTLRGKAGNALTTLDNLIRTGNMTPVYFFKHLGNEVLDTLWNDIRHGQNEFGLSLNDSKEFIEAMQEQYHYWDWTNKKNDLLEITTEKGRKLTFTREQALWLYATWKRETSNEVASTEHLTKGGIIYEGNTQEGKGLVTTVRSTPAVLSEGDIQRVVGWLTDAQKAYADGMVAYLSEDMADRGNRASMAMFGIRKYTEKYYFPYKVASSQLYQTSDAGKTSTTDDSRLKHSSFTNRLTKKASAPLVVGDFSTIVADHIARMTTYSSFVLPIESMNRVLNYKVEMEDGSRATVRSLIEQKYGEPAKRYIATLLSDLNGGVRSDNRVSGADYLVRMFKKGAVSASLSTALQQPTSIFRAMAMINPKYIAAATFSKRDWDELMKYSGVAVIKDMGRFDTDMGRSTVDWLNSKKLTRFMDKVDYISGWLPGKMDQMTWAHLWNAVKREQAAKNPNMDQQGEAFLTLCAERFNDIVDHTQVYDSILSRSQLMRGKDAMSKMVTSFMAEPTLTINMLYDAASGLNKPGGKAYAAKVFAATTVSGIAAAAMAALVQAWNDDDDKRTATTKYMDRFIDNAIDNINPLTMLPIISDAWSVFSGYDVQRADMSLIVEVKNAYDRLNSKTATPQKKLEGILGATAKFFGLPVGNVMRDGRRIYNLLTSRHETPSGYELSTAWPWADDKLESHYNELYLAMANNDSALEKEIRDFLTVVKGKDAKEIKSKVKSQLKISVLDGTVTKDAAIKWLVDKKLEDDQKTAFKTVDGWIEKAGREDDEDDSHSVYDDVLNAIKSGNSKALADAKAELKKNGYKDSEIYTGIRKGIQNWFLGDEITETKAKSMLRTYGNVVDKDGKVDEDEIYWKVEEWKARDVYTGDLDEFSFSRYEDFDKAVSTGRGLKAAIQDLMSHGVTKESLSSRITNQYKDELVALVKAGKTSQAAALQARILDAYVALGYNRDQKLRDVKKWYTETK